MRDWNPRHSAYLLLRLAMGINITMHGLQRLATGVDTFVGNTMQSAFAESFLPEQLTELFLTVLPWLELVFGSLLLFGIFTAWALIGGMAILLALIFGAAAQAMWEPLGLQMIYVLIYYILLRDVSANRFAIDSLLSKDKAKVMGPR